MAKHCSDGTSSQVISFTLPIGLSLFLLETRRTGIYKSHVHDRAKPKPTCIPPANGQKTYARIWGNYGTCLHPKNFSFKQATANIQAQKRPRVLFSRREKAQDPQCTLKEPPQKTPPGSSEMP
ncbi:MAG: hypothetical protein FRX48_01182 [Lasallia pustulata]|uniref:Uncharacterized protein n=1 Tax=Lasallia pustulata TaxID=136370 RepID=A0A5M8PXM4_9LECA|nr:MAG: hypothetical protein FRX48_01182 [Lasallia pustulata]